MEEKYYTSDEVEKGIDQLPKISKTTLRNLRMLRKITYTRVGRHCVYKKEWIEAYINSNIRSAKNNTLGDTHEK
ncbi:MAG: hypothetical protein PHI47_03510 [Sulfuricurvum sp.]|uniref:hypothetical protein n=1 Tax=Sulfuricurvum sp. TaxID=2025608 RepID=UPI002636AD3F|nr:hypothetical protein [Sulfuricurvum sp.]MDD5159094.1 hypothetical protein [Sulfuricurvum sp.]